AVLGAAEPCCSESAESRFDRRNVIRHSSADRSEATFQPVRFYLARTGNAERGLFSRDDPVVFIDAEGGARLIPDLLDHVVAGRALLPVELHAVLLDEHRPPIDVVNGKHDQLDPVAGIRARAVPALTPLRGGDHPPRSASPVPLRSTVRMTASPTRATWAAFHFSPSGPVSRVSAASAASSPHHASRRPRPILQRQSAGSFCCAGTWRTSRPRHDGGGSLPQPVLLIELGGDQEVLLLHSHGGGAVHGEHLGHGE